jgi:hypothetical protein
MTPEDVERIGASLLEGMPENPVDAHQWLMAKHAELCAIASQLEAAYHASADADVREAIQAHGLAVEWSISYVMGKASELLVAATESLGLPLSDDTREAIAATADSGAELSQQQRTFWMERGREHARELRRRDANRRHPARLRAGVRPRATAQPRPRGRRERHIATSTSSSDSGDDGPSDEPPSAEPPEERR